MLLKNSHFCKFYSASTKRFNPYIFRENLAMERNLFESDRQPRFFLVILTCLHAVSSQMYHASPNFEIIVIFMAWWLTDNWLFGSLYICTFNYKYT